jgi:amino acid permease
MRKSVTVSISTAFLLYLLVSIFCYLALGDSAHSMVLTSFDTAAPWATVLGNILVLVHMVSAFQVFCQPLFAAMEAGLSRQWPLLEDWAEAGRKRVHLLRLCIRGVYVAALTTVAMLFPFL